MSLEENGMKSTRPKKKAAPRAPRRWRTPPPLTRGSEPLEGMDLLREVGGETGVLLWQAYRNVMFWGEGEEGERAALFSPKAGEKRRQELSEATVPRPLADPLQAVAEMLDAPDAVPGERVAEACTAIARWAEQEGHGITALAFTQAAALASPRSAALPLAVGQLARRAGELARAESWFRHAIMIGRQIGDWESYSRAYISIGNMLVRRGNFPAAQRMHIKALRAARRKGLRELQGEALHDLFVIAGEMGRVAQAEDLARQAYRAYQPDHPLLPLLAGDVAYLWMEQGYFERALEVFRALEPHFWEPRGRIGLLSNIARAAAGAGQRDLYRKSSTEAQRLARQGDTQEVAPSCLLELAIGASMLEEWDRAEAIAEQAAEQAAAQSQAKVRLRAESVADAVRNGRKVEGQKERVKSTMTTNRAEALASDFVKSLGRTERQYA
jgi:tetratricopeptide (TPR) repeat protein